MRRPCGVLLVLVLLVASQATRVARSSEACYNRLRAPPRSWGVSDDVLEMWQGVLGGRLEDQEEEGACGTHYPRERRYLECPWLQANWFCPLSARRGCVTDGVFGALLRDPEGGHLLEDFMRSLLAASRREVWFVGDSKTRQQFTSFLCLLFAWDMVDPDPHAASSSVAYLQHVDEEWLTQAGDVVWPNSTHYRVEGARIDTRAGITVHYRSSTVFTPGDYVGVPPRSVVVTGYLDWYDNRTHWAQHMRHELPAFFRAKQGRAHEWIIVHRDPTLQHHFNVTASKELYALQRRQQQQPQQQQHWRSRIDLLGYPCQNTVSTFMWGQWGPTPLHLRTRHAIESTLHMFRFRTPRVLHLRAFSEAMPFWLEHPGYVPRVGAGYVGLFADCSHWCIPGVPDMWNLDLIRLVTERLRKEEHQSRR